MFRKSRRGFSKAFMCAAMFACCFALCFSAFGMELSYADTAEGKCGDNLTWVLENGTLTISGSGDMIDMENDASFRQYSSSINKIVVEPGVTSIGKSAFFGFENLKEISLPDGLTAIGDEAFSFCHALTAVDLPDGLTSIGESAFADCRNMKKLTLPSKTSVIGYQAFFRCGKLRTVDIPEGVTELGDSAFDLCESLKSVTLPSTLKSIGDNCFSCCPVREIILPEGLEHLGEWAFDESGLTSVDIPASVRTMGDSPFSQCRNLTSITVDPDNDKFTSEDGVLFSKNLSLLINYPAGRSDESYTIPDGVKTLGRYSMWVCGDLKSVDFPSSLEKIGELALCKSGLERVDVSSSDLAEIGKDAFSYCANLKTVKLPAALTKIGSAAFSNCRDIEDVYYEGDEESWGRITIGNNNPDLTGAEMHYGDKHVHFHEWGEPTYTWDNFERVTATAVCKEDSSHVLKETVETENYVSREPTDRSNGVIVYVARFENNDVFKAQSKSEIIPKTGETDEGE